MAREIKHIVVGWVLRVDLIKASMVNILPTVPNIEKITAHTAPIIDVASLKRMVVPSS